MFLPAGYRSNIKSQLNEFLGNLPGRSSNHVRHVSGCQQFVVMFSYVSNIAYMGALIFIKSGIAENNFDFKFTTSPIIITAGFSNPACCALK